MCLTASISLELYSHHAIVLHISVLKQRVLQWCRIVLEQKRLNVVSCSLGICIGAMVVMMVMIMTIMMRMMMLLVMTRMTLMLIMVLMMMTLG